MNTLVTRFFIFCILSFILPYSVTSYSYAAFDGGILEWKDVNGKVFIITNTVKVKNMGLGLPCEVTGCAVFIESGAMQLIGGRELPIKGTTLADVQRLIDSVQGQTIYRAGPSLCLTIGVNGSIQDFPRGCYGNAGAGVPPKEPDPPVTPPLTCNIGSGTINHLVASTSADRDSASTTVSVSCTGSTTVRVRAPYYDPNNGGMTLNGPDTLKSLIAIDGISAERGAVRRVDYYRNFTVSSELRSAANEIAGGEYSGSLIIVVATE
jgi:hypothetical protein